MEGGEIVEKIKKVIYGNPNIEDIETNDIENMNSICRERLGRLVRKTKCFSKKKPKLINSFELFHFYWNFMDKLLKLRLLQCWKVWPIINGIGSNFLILIVRSN